MKHQLMLLAAGFLMVPLAMVGQQGIDLTGYWQDNAGGKYEIRQAGNQLFWLDDARPRYINVYHGAISGNTIRGTWADLPGGRTQHTGSLDLRIESNDRLTKIASSVYFGGTTFTRTQGPASQGSYQQDQGANRAYQQPQAADRGYQGQNGNPQATSILGSWQTSSNGTPLTIRSDGTFTGANSDGRWREINSRDGIYELTWSNGSVNRVKVSADGQQLEDGSPFGGRVIATRMQRGQRRNRGQ